MTEEDRIAAAARLHVALRRKTGRVTDTEWMSVNIEYATAIVRIARAHAMATSDLDLAAIATGLEFAMAPLALEARVKAAAAKAGLAPVISKGAPRYVGGLR
jgi:hypothetical protein